jgi:hypothetical protein
MKHNNWMNNLYTKKQVKKCHKVSNKLFKKVVKIKAKIDYTYYISHTGSKI